MRRQFVVGILLLLAIPALADQIVLKNGDHLTGSITKSDGKELVIKTDYAGDLTIKFDAIQCLTSTGDLNVTAGGKTAVGPVTTTGDKIVVATKAGGPVEAPIASVTVLRNPAEEAAYQKSLHPGFAEGWAGGANLGFALTAGNSETKNLNIGLNAVRTGLHDKLTLYETSIYATTSKVALQPYLPRKPRRTRIPADSATTATSLRARLDSAVPTSSTTHLQNLDLRYILGGGIGFHAIKTPNTTLDLLAGINYTHESFSDLVLSPGPRRLPTTTPIARPL